MYRSFMGLRTRQFTCTSTEGDQLELMADCRESAMWTAAELFDMPISHIEVRYADEWKDDVHNHQSEQEVWK